MKLSAIKNHLSEIDSVSFKLPNGNLIPPHFHVTEIGLVTKHFIDCGGTERIEKLINFQLWTANDFEHRLSTQKLLDIIALSESKLGIGDLEIEVEHQGETIGKYGLEFNEGHFNLISKQTACLSPDACGIPPAKQKIRLSQLLDVAPQNACTPGGGCC